MGYDGFDSWEERQAARQRQAEILSSSLPKGSKIR